jgi:hypothetical protein
VPRSRRGRWGKWPIENIPDLYKGPMSLMPASVSFGDERGILGAGWADLQAARDTLSGPISQTGTAGLRSPRVL